VQRLLYLLALLAALGLGPAARASVLDLRGWDFSRDGIARLAGEWDFAWQRFEDPAAPPPDAPRGRVAVPGAWNHASVDGNAAGSFGHATYRLRVECRGGERLALALPLQHSAYRLYVNGRLAAAQGQPGASAAEARPAFLQQIAPLPAAAPDACPLDIVAHVSNYEMRQGGLLRSIELGEERDLRARRERGLARDLFALGGVVVLSLLPILFWLGRREDRAPLWVGVYGLSSAAFIAIGGERAAQPWMAPLGWEACWTLVLLLSLAGVAAFPSFLRGLYPAHFARGAHRAILAACALLALLVLATPARVYTQAVPVLYAVALGSAAWCVWVLVRAALARRPGAWLLLAGTGVLFATALHDTLLFSNLLASKLTPYGLLAFSVAPAVLLAQRFARALRSEELADRAKFTSDLVDSVPVALAMRDPAGNFVQVNRKWEEYFGARREEVVGRHVSERVRGGMLEALLELDRSVLERGPGAVLQQDDFDYRGRKFTQTRTVMADAQGAVLGVLVASIDTTERAAMERALESEQRRLDLVVRAQQVGIVDWDGRTHATFYSPRFRQILGHAADADTSKWPDYFKVLIHPEDREGVTRRWRAFVLGKSSEGRGDYYAPEEYRLLRADGSYVWVEVAGVAVRDEKGFVARWIAAVTDVTEPREQRDALARQRERLALLVRATKAGFMDWDAASDTRLYSERFKEMLGYAADADTSQWPSLFELMHADDREQMRDAFRDMLRQGQTGDERLHGPLEYRLRKADGSYLWVRGEGIARVGEDGRTERFVTSYVDITHLREMNLALEESVRLREEVDRISRHDLKTPLSSIIGFSRLLRDSGRVSAEDERLLGFIEQSGYRLLSMVNLSLDMLQMERGDYPFTPAPVDLRDVLEKVVRDLGAHLRAKQATFRVEGPRLHARAEDLLCYSMFANLARNAVEASPDGGVIAVTLAAAGDAVQVRMHNAGAVPEALHGRFFDKYSTAGKAGGSGLGTYSARLMARTQAGDIAMASGDGSTTLTVTLRRAEAPDGVAPIAAPEASAAPAPDAGAPLAVLVVDDDEYTRIFVQQFLGAARSATAANGKEALDAVQADPPDAIVMDLDMPVMGGLEAAAKVRQWESAAGRARCAMIAMSSHDDPAVAERCLQAGFDRFLAKPVSPDALRRALAELTRGAARASSSLPGAAPLAAQEAPAADATVHVRAKLKDALPGFLDSRRALAVELEQALAAGQAAPARALAHKLAGSFALYGFHWAAGQGKMIEKRAGTGALSGLAAEAAALRRHLETVKVEIAE
jgi:PAS domain S-box-containing protein